MWKYSSIDESIINIKNIKTEHIKYYLTSAYLLLCLTLGLGYGSVSYCTEQETKDDDNDYHKTRFITINIIKEINPSQHQQRDIRDPFWTG